MRHISRPAARIVFSVILAACGWCAAASAAPISADQAISPRPGTKMTAELEQAVAKFNQQQYDDALAMLNIAASKSPELPPGRTMLARLFFQSNQPAMGRAMLEQVIIESPSDPEAYRVLGDMAFNERRLFEAKLIFEKLGEVAQQFNGDASRKVGYESASFAGLAAVAEARQQWEVAVEHLNAWIAKDAKNAGAHHRLGTALFGQEKAEEAFKELQTAASLAKEFPAPEVTMGRLYHQAGKEDQAAEWMKKAIEAAPDSLAARVGVAQWQWESGQFDEAQKNVDAALKIKPDSLEALVIAGLVNRYQKNLAGAEGHFQTAHLASPGNAIAANQLALVLADQNDQAKQRRALELAESNAKQFNNNAEVAATLGWIYLQNNRVEDATRVFRAVMGTGRISADIAYYMAVLSDRAGNTPDAIKAVNSALGSKGPFAYRDEATNLLAKLEGKAGAGASATPTTASPASDSKSPAAATTTPAKASRPATTPAAKAPATTPATRPGTSKAGAGSKTSPPASKAPASKAPAKATPPASKAGAN